MTSLDELQPQLKRIQLWALVAGAVGIAACAFGAMQSSEQFFRSYLFGFLFWFGIAAGSLAFLMLHHLVSGGWGFVIQRMLESAARTLPLLLLLFVPIYFGMHELYLWARPEAVSADKILQHKSAYLNVNFFWVRAALYFALWIFFTFLLSKWSQQQDQTGDQKFTSRLEAISGPGLVLFVLSATFASVDWAMSLDPHWFSTIFGVLFVVSQGLTTLAFVIIMLNLLAKHQPISEVISRRQFHDLGTLMFAFVMLWAYVSFSQFLIIWSGNLPEEIPWYIQRLRGSFGVFATLVLVFHFVLPFVLLLLRRVKRNAAYLTKVAIAMLVARLIDLYWVVAPSFHHGEFHLHWMDLAAPLAIGGIWLAAFIGLLQGRALLPLHDPRMQEAFEAHGH